MALGPKTVPPIPRHELIATALELGISRPETLTESELTHCIQQVSEGRSEDLSHSRGWISVARNLVASVVEQGLNLPSAARVLRDGVRHVPPASQRPPLPTVTLARIYQAQGHADRARATLEQVLARNPHHSAARSLMAELDTEPTNPRVPDSVAVASDSVAPEAVAVASDSVAPEAVAVASASDPEPAQPEPVTTAAVPVPTDPEPVAAGRSPEALQTEPPPPLHPTAAPPTADWLVVLRAGDELIVYWELGGRGQRALQRGLPLRIRTLSCVPSPRGAETHEEEHVVSEVSGWLTLQKAPEVVVRAALGIADATAPAPGWVPLCVASSHRVVPGSDRLHVDYRPRKQQHDADVAARARKYAMRA